MTLEVGVVQRGGNIALQVQGDRSKDTFREFILSHTAPKSKAIFTDEWYAYAGIGDHDTIHDTVNHSIDEYAEY